MLSVQSLLFFAGGVVVAAGIAKWRSLRAADTTDSPAPATSTGALVNEKLIASEAMFRSLADVVPIGIFRTDAAGMCTFVNPRYCEISGQCLESAEGTCECTKVCQGACKLRDTSRVSAKGEGWRDAIHPDDRPMVYSAWADLLRDGVAFTLQYRMQRVDNSVAWVVASAQRQASSRFEMGMHVCSIHDITSSKLAEQEIQKLAFFDSLTGLPNRRLLMERIKQALTLSSRTGNYGALLYLDLDNFKLINDTLGHDVGDLLLQQVAQRLKGCIREGDTVARLGGDEFLVVLERLSAMPNDAGRQAEVIAEKILTSLNAPYMLADQEHYNSPSIGLTLFGQDRPAAEELMKRADMAMYQAKQSGRNTVRFYDAQMQALVAARVALESDLRHAVTAQEFVLHYQPQIDASNVVTGVEAFVRWNSPARGNVSTIAFIALAEETGLIIPLGHWVLQTACQQLADWSRHPMTAELSLSVKISGQQFRQSDFVQQVLDLVQSLQVNPKLLKLDLNESLLLADIEDIVEKTTALTSYGIGCSLADLGTGYSSLSHLKRLSLEQLRIDQSFVQGLLTEPNDASVTRSIFALAQSMDIKVSAEGVETQEQHDALAAFGCHSFQGYLFGQPMPVAAFELALAKQTASHISLTASPSTVQA